MTAPFEGLAELDRLIHEPARLAILTALGSCERADFLFLQSLTGLSKGNLSSHLSRLEEAKLVVIEKAFQGKTPTTTLRITPEGAEAVEKHWERLAKLRADSRKWTPPKDG